MVPLKYVTRAARKPAIYGYARVSTDGLSLDAQVKQLRSREGLAGNERRVRRAPDQLAKGDLMVTRLDRLACSTRDLLNTLGRGLSFAQ
jgi:DNA invertase Pin-like site-specific DNA recombinase